MRYDFERVFLNGLATVTTLLFICSARTAADELASAVSAGTESAADTEPAAVVAASKQESDAGAKSATDVAETANAVEAAATVAIDLLQGPLAERWTHFASRDGVALESVWSIVEEDKQRVLHCSGNPKGFLLTKETFADFDLSFEWKYVDDATGNSGVLIFTKNEPRLWPTSIQIQLHQPRTGAVFPTGDAHSDNSTEPPANGLAKEIGQWNICRIRSRQGRVAVEINDRSAGEVTGCRPASGHIAIQSEGSKTLFRNIRIETLPPPADLPGEELTTGEPQQPTEPAVGENLSEEI